MGRIVQKFAYLTPNFRLIWFAHQDLLNVFTQKTQMSLIQWGFYDAYAPIWQELAVVRIVLLVLSLFAVGAWAQQSDVHRVEVPVANQSEAERIAANASTAQGVMLYVVDVKDFTAFKQVQAYLKTVGVIRSVHLVSVEKDVLQFNVLLDGDEQLLKTTLDAGNKLQVIVGDTLKPMSFRWQN